MEGFFLKDAANKLESQWELISHSYHFYIQDFLSIDINQVPFYKGGVGLESQTGLVFAISDRVMRPPGRREVVWFR